MNVLFVLNFYFIIYCFSQLSDIVYNMKLNFGSFFGILVAKLTIVETLFTLHSLDQKKVDVTKIRSLNVKCWLFNLSLHFFLFFETALNVWPALNKHELCLRIIIYSSNQRSRRKLWPNRAIVCKHSRRRTPTKG